MTKEERKEYNRKWYLKNKEKILEKKNQYYQENKDKIREQNLDNKDKRKEYDRQYYLKKRDKLLEHSNQYYHIHKEERIEYQKNYTKTPIGRANNLLNQYKLSDEKHKRGNCTLTAKWIVENIFSKPCHYCGETDWNNIGCDRIINSKPHTPDNVVPCCTECNRKKNITEYEKWLMKINID